MTTQPHNPTGHAQALLTRHLYVSGRVQGVSFRYFMRDQAQSLGVNGWCRNLPDGRVEAWIQGPEHLVEIMTEWASHGPDAAVVDHLEVIEEESPEGRLQEFEIRR